MEAKVKQIGKPLTPSLHTALRRWRPYLWGLLFLLPEIIIFSVFQWKPIVMSIYYSMTNVDVIHGNSFVGFENYRRVFEDDAILIAVKNTLYYVFLGLVIGFWVPSVAALALSELRWFRGTARLIVYLPNIVPAVVLYGMWKWLYDPIGPVNQFLGWLSIEPVRWLTDKMWAMASIVFMSTWQHFGATTLIYLAAILGVPKDLYEAAEIDGARVWHRIIYITLPSIKMIFLLMFVMQFISTSQSYEAHLAMTDGGPNNATLTYMLHVVKNGFYKFDFGKASAMGVLMFVVLTSLSVALYRLQRKEDHA
ncbi:sugar ABC transporter permease [Paenibacillus sp. N4]|uniref:carbohydrate ABC transporter permease n=1 Tax=Paenibacillus vietnamensis TaxID=2590547 RepID=UPI001CD16BD8|nr:sugar ABC transporter permease [Paenibacillus vietnamensis]MCA0754261.1 sugar ABC transporter permease [Paenibacillus vietnamensis]